MNNKNAAYHILRVGMGVTFLWIGILILANPESWGVYLQPWALNLLVFPLKTAMIATAILDIVIGLLFLLDVWVVTATVLAAAHLVVVLVVSGINSVTVRDIAILAAALAMMHSAMTPRQRAWLTFKKLKSGS